ncbi:MAG TPA: LysR substrate-binding domain-containing protein [Candidatus Limnocylindria bacterium]|nr:LysR substrate-binding domain-containing protein [Candidatus Limnocylindria bacterium]
MELHQLRYFVAVAEQRHFTRAAREIGVAQPSVSKQIGKLESEIGAPLFSRTRSGVVLTQAGEVLLPWARRILEGVDGARVEVRELTALARGRLAVGATPSLTTVLLPPVLARFHDEHPGVELQVREAGSRDLLEGLASGACEVALVIMPVPASISARPLLREELVVAVARGHPLAKRREVSLADLRGVPLVMFRDGYDLRASTLAACARAGFEPTIAVEGGEMDGVLRMTAAGLGAAVVPSIVVERGGPLVAVRLVRPGLQRTIGVAYRKDWPLSRAAEAFIAAAGEFAAAGALPRGVTALA